VKPERQPVERRSPCGEKTTRPSGPQGLNLTEPPGADRHAGWCGRGECVTTPPMPIVCRACLSAGRCKSSSQRDGREVIAKRKGAASGRRSGSTGARAEMIYGTAETGSGQGPSRYSGGQGPRTVAVGEQSGPGHRAAQRLLCLVRDSAVHCASVAQSTESPYTDPYGAP